VQRGVGGDVHAGGPQPRAGVHALRRAAEHLAHARTHVEQGDAALELLAEELRLAHQCLCEITGAFTPDDLLGEIFGRFCIGK